MLVLFLTPLGVTSGQAIALGLLWYACLLGASMVGAPAFAVGHRHRATDDAGAAWHEQVAREEVDDRRGDT
jgi:hypothetical protein